MPEYPAVGIDLGTTYSVIAYIDETGKPVAIPNSEAELITPSVVLFDEGSHIIVGREAKRASFLEPTRVVECIKREMGTDYTFSADGKSYKPEHISGMILKKLKQDAVKRIGNFEKVVITVPAFFDDTRRKATQDAGRLAGLDVIDILNEPAAAALAYGFQITDKNSHVVVVYDLGGGTFDVTLVKIGGGEIHMLATDGDVKLGGKDWDDCIINYVAEEFKKSYNSDPREDPESLQNLAFNAEESKITLSKRNSVTIQCNHAGYRIKVTLTREHFEEMTKALLYRTETTTSLLLEDAGMKWDQVERVLLVGGSSYMPMVRDMLKRVTGKEPDDSLAVNEVVAHGAAIYANMIKGGVVKGGVKSQKVVNVNSHSLGVVVRSKKYGKPINVIMIPKNTPIPHSVTRIFELPSDGCTTIRLPIVEGEDENPDHCIQIGNFVIRGLSPSLTKGSPVQVTYEYRGDGRINVHAIDMTNGTDAATEIERKSGLSLHEIMKGEKDIDSLKID